MRKAQVGNLIDQEKEEILWLEFEGKPYPKNFKIRKEKKKSPNNFIYFTQRQF